MGVGADTAAQVNFSPAELDVLLSGLTVRERAGLLLERALAGGSTHFTVARERIADTVAYVAAVADAAYPDRKIPIHGRWRHLQGAGSDLVAELRRKIGTDEPAAVGACLTEMTMISVLVDAGAGPTWCFRDGAKNLYRRSEGLAIAALRMYEAGIFSAAAAREPYRVDAERLQSLTVADLAHGFQVTDENPLVGLDGRLDLLHRLGTAVASTPRIFPGARLGDLPGALAADAPVTRAGTRQMAADRLLHLLLRTLKDVWPKKTRTSGGWFGDIWRHDALASCATAPGFIPFHKLTQWLTYSLLEPLSAGGIELTDLEVLTGLPEYRNGGLFLDAGVIRTRDPEALGRTYHVGDEFVIELRALTVALLDQVAEGLRHRWGRTAESLPLASVLEGGTWAAGRRMAAEKRPGDGGGPPFKVVSDGTVF